MLTTASAILRAGCVLGVVFVTSRVLVVDMLVGRLPMDHVRGIVVPDAHRVIPTSSEVVSACALFAAAAVVVAAAAAVVVVVVVVQVVVFVVL